MKQPKKILIFLVSALFSFASCTKENRDNCDVAPYSFNVDLDYKLAKGADQDNTVRQNVDQISVYLYDASGTYIKTVSAHEANLATVGKYVRINVPVDAPGEYRFVVIGDTSLEEQYGVTDGSQSSATTGPHINNLRVTVNDNGTGLLQKKFVENTYIAEERGVVVPENKDDVATVYAEFFRKNKTIDIFVRNQASQTQSDNVVVEFSDFNRFYNNMGVTPKDADGTYTSSKMNYKQYDYSYHPADVANSTPWHEMRFETMQLTYENPLMVNLMVKDASTNAELSRQLDIMEIIKNTRDAQGNLIYQAQIDLEYQNHYNIWVTYLVDGGSLKIAVSVLNWEVIPVTPIQ